LTPDVALVAVYVNVEPEQTDDVKGELNSGAGLTLNVTFCVLLQPLAVNVNTYTTFIGSEVVLVSTSLMAASDTLVRANCDMPVTAARDQLKVVPDVALVAVYVNVEPEHIADG
jgi:hypothetical protein